MERVIKKYIEEARCSALCSDYGKAYAFYLLVLKLCPQIKHALAEEFSVAWKEWSCKLRQIGRVVDLFTMYEQGCEVFVENDMLHFYMGNALFHLNLKIEAIGMFRKALLANQHCHEARISLENACRRSVDSWHFAMLNDIHRNNSFKLAISKVIKKNDIVMDIGTGTGILSMLAAQHKPNKVFACEVSTVMQSIANECIALNKMESCICLLPCYSTNLSVKQSIDEMNCNETISEKCSLVISETVDAGLFGEGIIETLSHAWKNLLLSPNSGGRVIPYSATLCCALIECKEIFEKHSVVEMHNLPGIVITSGVSIDSKDKLKNFNAGCESIATCNLEPYTSEKLKRVHHRILTSSQKLTDIDFNDPTMIENILLGRFENIASMHCVTQSGYIDAVVLWFDLILENSKKSSTVINTSIESEHCWDQAIYPVRVCEKIPCKPINSSKRNTSKFVFKRLEVNKGENIRTNFAVHSDCLILNNVEKCLTNDEINVIFPNLFSIPFLFESDDDILHIAAREEQVLRMNDSSFSNMCFQGICAGFSMSSSQQCIVLDISNEFDLLAVKFAKILNAKLHKYCQTPDIEKALSKICKLCHIDITFHLEIPYCLKTNFDVIFLHVIEPSGLMSPKAISNLTQATSCLSPSGIVIPNRVSLVCQIICSDELISKCMVLPENTFGLNIAEVINDFRVSVHSDLDVNSLSYTKLSSPRTIFNYKLNLRDNDLLNMQTVMKIRTIDSGIAHGVLFWFKLNVYQDVVIDTSEPSNHWKQACYVFPSCKHLALKAGEEVELKATSINDSQLFFISKCDTKTH